MDFVAQVKAAVDIVGVIGEYTRLKRAGGTGRYSGLCPFHKEKTPSFSVSATHQFYKCFGCSAGGDVFKFVMEMEHVSFFEALKSLAARAGLEMPKRSEYSDPETKLRGALFEMHEQAARFFQQNLFGAPGEQARRYLETRGVTRQAAEHFQLGYADRGGQTLLRLLERQNFSAEELEKSGLVLRRNDGSGFFDRFRNRLIFPIQSEAGKVIAFAGRSLDPDDQPKYLNSAETPLYRKSYVLYNLHRAKEGIRKAERTVLVEGYMDVIGVASAGVREVVASCGTALTSQQVQSLRRHSNRIIVNFDPDTAGASAAERSIQMLLDEGMHVRVLDLEDGLDPDEYCKKHGANRYCEKLDAAKGYFYWLADRARGRFDIRSSEGRVSALQFLLPAVQRIPDAIERATVGNDLANYLGIEPSVVLDSFKKSVRDRKARTMEAPARGFHEDERLLLRLLLENAEAREELLPELRAAVAGRDLPSKPVLEAIFAQAAAGEEVNFASVYARLDADHQKILSDAVLDGDYFAGDETAGAVPSLEFGVALLDRWRSRSAAEEEAALRAQIRSAERAGDMAAAMGLMEELNRRKRIKV